MSSFEKISDEKVADLIQALIRKQTLVKVAVPNGDFEQLTVITATRSDGGQRAFQIDPPKGLHAALRQNSCDVLLFEFSTDNRLPHRFESSIKESGEEFWLHFPEHIQRFQLRNNFRIKAPANVHATGFINETKVTMTVDNISLGGLFCHCPNTDKPLIYLGLKMQNLDLVFSFGGERQMLTISRAAVRRVEGRTRPKHFGVAFEFLHMKAEAKKRLTQIIYDLQRDFLKNRLKDE